MNGYIADAISIVPLSLGSILMLACGSGFISSKYGMLAGLLCFVVSALIEVIFKKKFDVTDERR
ncbi:MAG: hypothetical protein JW837_11315 [Sedimentisphaerales bacterium]|nr:hypothetical protein [Sedimentisphaerales bacterium]